MERPLPPIPVKRYFTISEVGDLCGVKPHVLRYWEQEFTQLRPMKRRGNRRYYQHHEVLMIRRIRDLLYDQGFTISGARNRMQEVIQTARFQSPSYSAIVEGLEIVEASESELLDTQGCATNTILLGRDERWIVIHRELSEIRNLLLLTM
jgi:DNA-binding transcriptional MerR regulator